MPTYAITPKGIKRYHRIVPIVETGRESYSTFTEHLILDRLVRDGHSNFDQSTMHAWPLEQLERAGKIQRVENPEEEPRLTPAELRGDFNPYQPDY